MHLNVPWQNSRQNNISTTTAATRKPDTGLSPRASPPSTTTNLLNTNNNNNNISFSSNVVASSNSKGGDWLANSLGYNQGKPMKEASQSGMTAMGGGLASVHVAAAPAAVDPFAWPINSSTTQSVPAASDPLNGVWVSAPDPSPTMQHQQQQQQQFFGQFGGTSTLSSSNTGFINSGKDPFDGLGVQKGSMNTGGMGVGLSISGTQRGTGVAPPPSLI